MPLSSAGVTLLLRYYGPIRHTASPVHSSRITSWCVLTPLTGLPVLPLLSSSMRALPIPRRKSYRCSCRSLPNTPTAFLLISKESASTLPFSRPARHFMCCSPLCAVAHKTFTHVLTRLFAKSPESTLLSRVLQTMLSPP